MGLFDRIFLVGQERPEEQDGGTDYAPTSWQPDEGAQQAIQRHHEVIERRLAESAGPMGSGRGQSGHFASGSQLSGWDDHDGLDQVIGRLQGDADPHMRALAARTLGMMPGRRSMEALAKSLQDPEEIVCQAARDALWQLGVRTSLT